MNNVENCFTKAIYGCTLLSSLCTMVAFCNDDKDVLKERFTKSKRVVGVGAAGIDYMVIIISNDIK
jgi:hypothetical protein